MANFRIQPVLFGGRDHFDTIQFAFSLLRYLLQALASSLYVRSFNTRKGYNCLRRSDGQRRSFQRVVDLVDSCYRSYTSDGCGLLLPYV